MKNMNRLFFFIALIFMAFACNKMDSSPSNFTDGDAGQSEIRGLAMTEANQSLVSEEPPAPPQSNDNPPPADPKPTAPPPQPGKQPLEKPQPIARQIIKTARYRIQVKNVDESTNSVTAFAARHGGFISSTALQNSNYQITNSITIRVPANRFDSLMTDIGKGALYTQFKQISSEDVTEEYVDILIRLKTKKEVRDRYVDILRTKAKTVADVLAAEEQIRVIQEEIESKEGRLRFLKDQVAMSTIHLELYQEIEYRPEPSALRTSFWTNLGEALKDGWHLVQGMVIGLVSIWPLVILGILAWWKRRWLFGRFRRNNGAKEQPEK